MALMLDPTPHPAANHDATGREIAEHLAAIFPAIAPSFMRGGGCWVSWALTQGPEHNPPMYWLGRAFDVLAASPEATALARFASQLRAAHGDDACAGDERDGRLQDVLTEMCAFAWAEEHLGRTEVIEASRDGRSETLIHVPATDTTVVPRRLRPEQTMEQVMQQVARHAEESAAALDSGRGILYLDIWHERRYAQSIGFRFEITEPVRMAVRHFAPEHGLGYVLTRPFEWGRPLEEWF